MSTLVPVLLHCASTPTGNEKEEVLRREGAARLLELAVSDQGAFRSTVGMLGEESRGLLEELLRTAGVGRRRKVDGGEEGKGEGEGDERPTIELRMDF